MEAWVDTLVKGQEEVIRIVRENLRVQRERQEATGRIPEFPVGTYVLVEHVNNLRRRWKTTDTIFFRTGQVLWFSFV